MTVLAALCIVGWILFAWNAIAANSEIGAILRVRRADRRLADERWQLLQERHDAVIELIAQIPECGCPRATQHEVKGAPRQRRKAK